MRVLIIDSMHYTIVEKFLEAGFSCVYLPDISASEINEVIENYEVVILRSKVKFDKILIDKATKLKIIGRLGAGMENIDIQYATSKGVKCINSPEGNRNAVGEHAIGMLLSLINNILRADHEVRSGKWLREENRGFEIKEKTIGIIGYGHMGSSFARKLAGFDANVIAYDKYKFNYSNQFVREVSLQEIFETADILSLHVPLTEETKYMVDNQFIANFKKNIVVINTSRGKVLKTIGLVSAMKTGKVIGACLDVLEYEDTTFEKTHQNIDNQDETFNYLLHSDRVILTPHIAGWTVESNRKMAEILADKIINKCSTTF